MIAFTVNFSDASGHIALWDGRMFKEQPSQWDPNGDDYSTTDRPPVWGPVKKRYIEVKTSLGEFWEL